MRNRSKLHTPRSPIVVQNMTTNQTQADNAQGLVLGFSVAASISFRALVNLVLGSAPWLPETQQRASFKVFMGYMTFPCTHSTYVESQVAIFLCWLDHTAYLERGCLRRALHAGWNAAWKRMEGHL